MADLPPFNLQTEPDGSLAATMGKDIKIWCDRLQGQLVFEYSADVPVSANDVLGFEADPFADTPTTDGIFQMQVTLEGQSRLVGRAPVNDALLSILGTEHMAIVAPTDLGEPLYTGRSEALLRVAHSCRV